MLVQFYSNHIKKTAGIKTVLYNFTSNGSLVNFENTSEVEE